VTSRTTEEPSGEVGQVRRRRQGCGVWLLALLVPLGTLLVLLVLAPLYRPDVVLGQLSGTARILTPDDRTPRGVSRFDWLDNRSVVVRLGDWAWAITVNSSE
jgi:hypothetical protein